MENFIYSASVVLPLFLLIALGYVFRRIGVFTDEYVKRTNKICFRVFMPAMIFMSIYTQGEQVKAEFATVKFVIVASVILITILWVAIPLFEKDNYRRGTLVQACFRSNALLFGVPLITNMYGDAGLAPIAVVIATVVPLYNGITVVIFSFFGNMGGSVLQTVKQILKDLVSNPLILGALAALMAVVFHIQLPFVIEKTVSNLAAIATPLALLSLGGGFRFDSAFVHLNYIGWVSLVKMVLNPAVMVTIAAMIGFEGPRLAAIMILYGTPVAVTSQVMAQEMGADGQLAGELTVVTSMISCFSIFAFIYILKIFNLL